MGTTASRGGLTARAVLRAGRGGPLAALGAILMAIPPFLGAAAAPRTPARGDEPATQHAARVGPAARDLAGLASATADGVDVGPIRAAAGRLLDNLPATPAAFPADPPAWDRRLAGDGATSVDARQGDAADLIRATLGADGLRDRAGVARLGRALAALDRAGMLGRVEVLGIPSADEPWGWHLDGPRLALTALVAGDRVVLLPNPLGIGPAADAGLALGPAGD